MGFNTTVVVHNDALHEIEKDKDFGKNLVDAITQNPFGERMVSVPAGCHANAVEVIEQHHADTLIAVVVGANGGYPLGRAGHWELLRKDDEGKVEMLRNLAEKYGYELRKKREKK